MNGKEKTKSEILKTNIISCYFLEHMSQADIARKFNISREYVSYIVHLEDKEKVAKEKEYRKKHKTVKKSFYLTLDENTYLLLEGKTKKENLTPSKWLKNTILEYVEKEDETKED